MSTQDWQPNEDRVEAGVAALLRAEHRAACEDAHPPAAGVVWWRAERRMRQEAARAAARPTTVMHALAVACAAGAAVALFQFLAPWLRQWMRTAAGITQVFQWNVAELTSSTTMMLAFVAVASLVVAPLALYVALSDK